MIPKPTTLILGAGASEPFGFPTGYQLLQLVLKATNPSQNTNKLHYFEWFHHTPSDVDKFHKALLKSGHQSVDSFLEHRPEFISIGKVAMALVLISYENERELFKRDGKSWYEYLFKQLNTSYEDFNSNKLFIITFNYDRSLEHFLISAITNAYGKPVKECLGLIANKPIIHLHGDLGGMSEFGEELFREYNTDINQDSLRIASNRIKIIHNDNLDETSFAWARRVLSGSEVICFLGFGYHPLNMERLGFNPNPHSGFSYRGKNITGTTFGLTDAECRQINNRYGLGLRGASGISYPHLDVLQFLKETGILHGN